MQYDTCHVVGAHHGVCHVACCMANARWQVLWCMPHGMPRDMLYGVCQVNENCDLKICDFGLARMSEIPEKAMLMTCYVVTRW